MKIRITICKSDYVKGLIVYANDYRVRGSNPIVGTIIDEFDIDTDKLPKYPEEGEM